MSEHKSEIERKINNVKEWLSSAENSFKQEKELKGQLNLMLAQAEMKTLNKANAKWHRLWPRIVLSLLLLALTAGIIYNLFTKDKKIDTIIRSNFQTQETKPIVEQPAEMAIKEPEPTNIVSSKAKAQPLKPQETERTFTELEKRNLIKQAQQSLHGELKR